MSIIDYLSDKDYRRVEFVVKAWVAVGVDKHDTLFKHNLPFGNIVELAAVMDDDDALVELAKKNNILDYGLDELRDRLMYHFLSYKPYSLADDLLSAADDVRNGHKLALVALQRYKLERILEVETNGGSEHVAKLTKLGEALLNVADRICSHEANWKVRIHLSTLDTEYHVTSEDAELYGEHLYSIHKSSPMQSLVQSNLDDYADVVNKVGSLINSPNGPLGFVTYDDMLGIVYSMIPTEIGGVSRHKEMLDKHLNGFDDVPFFQKPKEKLLEEVDFTLGKSDASPVERLTVMLEQLDKFQDGFLNPLNREHIAKYLTSTVK